MPFRFYTNMLSQASRTAASGILLVGLLLIGFGAVIAAFPEVFAYLAAAIFFLAGLSCAVFALKLLWAQRQFHKKFRSDDNLTAYRKNVRIHTNEPYEG